MKKTTRIFNRTLAFLLIFTLTLGIAPNLGLQVYAALSHSPSHTLTLTIPQPEVDLTITAILTPPNAFIHNALSLATASVPEHVGHNPDHIISINGANIQYRLHMRIQNGQNIINVGTFYPVR